MPFAVRAVPPADTRPLRQAILRPHQSIDELAAHEPPEAFAVAAFDAEDRLVAVGLIAPDGDPGGWRIRGMATAPEARHRGAGAAILHALIAHAHSRCARRIWCHARTPAQSLYARAGLRIVSDVFELPQIGPHVVMEWRATAERPGCGAEA